MKFIRYVLIFSGAICRATAQGDPGGDCGGIVRELSGEDLKFVNADLRF